MNRGSEQLLQPQMALERCRLCDCSCMHMSFPDNQVSIMTDHLDIKKQNFTMSTLNKYACRCLPRLAHGRKIMIILQVSCGLQVWLID